VFEKQDENLDEYADLVDRLKYDKAKCYKYNQSIDQSVQNFASYEAILELSKDGTRLNITNKKPIENPKYVLESDPAQVQKALEKFKQAKSDRR